MKLTTLFIVIGSVGLGLLGYFVFTGQLGGKYTKSNQRNGSISFDESKFYKG